MNLSEKFNKIGEASKEEILKMEVSKKNAPQL